MIYIGQLLVNWGSTLLGLNRNISMLAGISLCHHTGNAPAYPHRERRSTGVGSSKLAGASAAVPGIEDAGLYKFLFGSSSIGGIHCR